MTARRYAFETLDVFTRQRFGGNPLAVVHAADALSDAAMKTVASEFNLSETIFLRAPQDPDNTASVRIFNRTHELPFAGHPAIGAAVALARRVTVRGPVRLEAQAGLIVARLEHDDDGSPIGATIIAPQPLSLGPELSVAEVAHCLGLSEKDLVTASHRPRVASMGSVYVLSELRPEALARCAPDLSAFRAVVASRPDLAGRLSIHVYARSGAGPVRARMFAPLAGTWEDPATGSANGPLAGLLLQLSGADSETFQIEQGADMGRPSHLTVRAWRADQAIHAEIAGGCVSVMQGEITI